MTYAICDSRINKLYATRLGSRRVAAEVDGPVFDTTKEGRSIPFLDAVASRSADGKSLYIKAVNSDREHALETTIAISGVTVGPHARRESVRGSSPDVFNSFATPV